VFLLLITPDSHPALAGVGPFIMGFGMGLLNITSMVMIQGSVEWSKRGQRDSLTDLLPHAGEHVGRYRPGRDLNFGVVLFASEQGAPLSTAQIHELLGNIGNIIGGGNGPALRTALDRHFGSHFGG